jgi:hypothetical protein
MGTLSSLFLLFTQHNRSFGYVVEGSDYLSDVEEGDMIVSAKVTKGLEHLVQPKAVA